MEIVNNFQWQVARNFAATGCDLLRLERQPLHQKSAHSTTNGFIYLRLLCSVSGTSARSGRAQQKKS